MGQYFNKAHVRAQNIISDWKVRNLLISLRITRRKCLPTSQFNYVASIIGPTDGGQNRRKLNHLFVKALITCPLLFSKGITHKLGVLS